MSQKDETVEYVRYIKIFFTVILASLFALLGWIANNFTIANHQLLWLSIMVVVLLIFSLFYLHIIIKKKIKLLRGL